MTDISSRCDKSGSLNLSLGSFNLFIGIDRTELAADILSFVLDYTLGLLACIGIKSVFVKTLKLGIPAYALCRRSSVGSTEIPIAVRLFMVSS